MEQEATVSLLPEPETLRFGFSDSAERPKNTRLRLVSFMQKMKEAISTIERTEKDSMFSLFSIGFEDEDIFNKPKNKKNKKKQKPNDTTLEKPLDIFSFFTEKLTDRITGWLGKEESDNEDLFSFQSTADKQAESIWEFGIGTEKKSATFFDTLQNRGEPTEAKPNGLVEFFKTKATTLFESLRISGSAPKEDEKNKKNSRDQTEIDNQFEEIVTINYPERDFYSQNKQKKHGVLGAVAAVAAEVFTTQRQKTELDVPVPQKDSQPVSGIIHPTAVLLETPDTPRQVIDIDQRLIDELDDSRTTAGEAIKKTEQHEITGAKPSHRAKETITLFERRADLEGDKTAKEEPEAALITEQIIYSKHSNSDNEKPPAETFRNTIKSELPEDESRTRDRVLTKTAKPKQAQTPATKVIVESSQKIFSRKPSGRHELRSRTRQKEIAVIKPELQKNSITIESNLSSPEKEKVLQDDRITSSQQAVSEVVVDNYMQRRREDYRRVMNQAQESINSAQSAIKNAKTRYIARKTAKYVSIAGGASGIAYTMLRLVF